MRSIVRPALFASVASVAALASLALLAGCKTSAGSSPEGPAESKPAEHIQFTPAGEGDVPSLVLAAVAREKAAGRRLVVYEGAQWCEPCRHFHEAVASGKLDAAFPDVTLLEFDADHDKERLVAAGYGSQYIPLFALPGSDGRSGPKAQGGIKGDGAVPYLTKKLRELLAQGTQGTQRTQGS